MFTVYQVCQESTRLSLLLGLCMINIYPPAPNLSWEFLVSQVMWWLELPIELQAHTRLSYLAHGRAPAQHTLVVWSRWPGCRRAGDGATVHWVLCPSNIHYCVSLRSQRHHGCWADYGWLSSLAQKHFAGSFQVCLAWWGQGTSDILPAESLLINCFIATILFLVTRRPPGASIPVKQHILSLASVVGVPPYASMSRDGANQPPLGTRWPAVRTHRLRSTHLPTEGLWNCKYGGGVAVWGWVKAGLLCAACDKGPIVSALECAVLELMTPLN